MDNPTEESAKAQVAEALAGLAALRTGAASAGVDLTGLPPDRAAWLGAATGEAILTLAAEARGYEQAVAVLADVADRTGSPAARWAADYLAADPDRMAPSARIAEGSANVDNQEGRSSVPNDHFTNYLPGPWVAILSAYGCVYPSVDEAIGELGEQEEVQIAVVRGTAEPNDRDGTTDGVLSRPGTYRSGDVAYQIDCYLIDRDDESAGAHARYEQARAMAAGLNYPVTPCEAAALDRLLDAYLGTELSDPGLPDLHTLRTKLLRLDKDHSAYNEAGARTRTEGSPCT